MILLHLRRRTARSITEIHLYEFVKNVTGCITKLRVTSVLTGVRQIEGKFYLHI